RTVRTTPNHGRKNVMFRQTAAWITLLFTSFASLLADDTRPSVQEKGFVLPNGWTVSPAGRQVVLSDLPLNILPLADKQHALVAPNGNNKREVCLADLVTQGVVERQEGPECWFGLVVDEEGGRFGGAGGGAGVLLLSSPLKDRKRTRPSPAAPKVS